MTCGSPCAGAPGGGRSASPSSATASSSSPRRRAPPRAGSRAVVREKLPWVRRKLAEFEALGPPPEPRQVVAGELFPYLGREYRLELADRPPQPVTISGDVLEVDRALDGDARAAGRRLVRGEGARVRRRRRRALRAARRRRSRRRRRPRPGQAPLGRLRPPHPDGELPLAADHAAARAGRLRRRPRAGPPPRAQPRGRVLAAGRGRHAGLQGAPQASHPERRQARRSDGHPRG